MPRPAMARIYVGDVGTIVQPTEKPKFPKGLDLSSLSFRNLCILAVTCGVPVKDLIGKDNCYEHQDMIAIGGREMPAGFNLFDHCIYCRNCFLFYRLRRLPSGD